MPPELTADGFLARLTDLASPAELDKYQRAFRLDENYRKGDDRFIGVRMGHAFSLAREHVGMPLPEIERLMESDVHEARVGAMSIMDKQARAKKTGAAQRQALFDLYLRRLDRVNDWDLVDLAAQHVIGAHLIDSPRNVLYELAADENPWARRTALVASFAFIRRGDLDDAFRLAELLASDKREAVSKAVGWVLRTAGDADRQRLLDFLEGHAATMPRVALRAAIEHLTPEQRSHYLAQKRR